MPTPYNYGNWRNHTGDMGWRSIQPTKGTYTGSGIDQANMVLDWTVFDQRIAQAITQGVELCWHIWLTPSWASIAGDQVGGSNTVIGPWNVAGESAVPSNMQFVRDITTAVVQRAIARGKRIKYIEPLNEPEFYDASALAAYIAASGKPFWTGTAAQAVAFAWACYSAAKAADPNVIVLMPSQYSPARMLAYLQAQDPVSGKFGHETFDYVNLHPYRAAPNKALGGEDLYYMAANRIGVAEAGRLIAQAGSSAKPIACTEWGLDTQSSSITTDFSALTAAQRKTYVSRMLAMAALNGVKLFSIFSNGTLAGDYTNDTTGVIAAVSDVHSKLSGQRIVAGGWTADGGVVAKLANGQTHVW